MYEPSVTSSNEKHIWLPAAGGREGGLGLVSQNSRVIFGILHESMLVPTERNAHVVSKGCNFLCGCVSVWATPPTQTRVLHQNPGSQKLSQDQTNVLQLPPNNIETWVHRREYVPLSEASMWGTPADNSSGLKKVPKFLCVFRWPPSCFYLQIFLF